MFESAETVIMALAEEIKISLDKIILNIIRELASCWMIQPRFANVQKGHSRSTWAGHGLERLEEIAGVCRCSSSDIAKGLAETNESIQQKVRWQTYRAWCSH